MKRMGLLAVALCLVSSAALAKEVAGVTFPESVTADGKALKLKGAGVRTKVFFKVYAAGLYLEDPALDASAIISADQMKRVQLVMLRDVEKQKIAEAIADGFAKNSKEQLPKLQERLNKFTSALLDTKKGDQLVFTAVPGKGLVASGKVDFTIEGKDFADALFAVWLGKDPVEGGLKKAMLGAE